MTLLIVTLSEDSNKDIMVKASVKQYKNSTIDEIDTANMMFDEIQYFLDKVNNIAAKLDEKEVKELTLNICKNIGKE